MDRAPLGDVHDTEGADHVMVQRAQHKTQCVSLYKQQGIH